MNSAFSELIEFEEGVLRTRNSKIPPTAATTAMNATMKSVLTSVLIVTMM